MRCFFIFLMCSSIFVHGQTMLPEQMGQHNLTQFNSSLFFPTASYGWQNLTALSIWSRWQFQTVDEDPSSIFANYTTKVGANTRLGFGYFENTVMDSYKQGGVLNFSQAIELSLKSKLIFGANLFGFQLENFGIINSQNNLGETEFLGELTLGAQLMVGNFSLTAALDHALDYNFTTSEREDSERLVKAALSYDIPLNVFTNDTTSFLRPIVYYRVMPQGYNAQYGLNALFSTSRFWVQGGYNSFYGPSGGLGVTLFKRLSLGGLIEIPIDSSLKDENPTIEVLLSYRLGKFSSKKDQGKEEGNEKSEPKEENDLMKDEAYRLMKESDSLNQINLAKREQLLQDSIATIRHKAAELLEQQRLDSIESKEQQNLRKANDIYTSPVKGLQTGYYLIVNVYRTKKYFNLFMEQMKRRGLEPKHFYRKANGFNYVYLRRYDTVMEAIDARNSRLEGKYKNRIWIFEAL